MEDAPLVRRARRQVRLVLGCIVVLSVLAMSSLILPFLPYEPLTIYDFEPVKTEACPLEIVPVTRDYRIQPGTEITEIEVDPTWIAVDVPGVKEGSVLEGPEAAYTEEETAPGRRNITSSILRVAPTQPGIWRLGATTTVRGTPYIFPQTEVLELRSDETVRVLEMKDEECQGRLASKP